MNYLKLPSDVSFVQVKDCPKQRSHFELVRRCDKSSGNIFVSFSLVLHFIEFSPFPLFHMRHETNLHCTKSTKFKRDGNLSVHSVVSQLPNTGLSIRSFLFFSGSLASANSSILAARRLFKEVVGKKSGFYVN